MPIPYNDKMRRLTSLKMALYVIGAVLLVAGALLYLWFRLAACVLYVAGAALFASMQLYAVYEGSSHVVRRLRRQQLFGLLCVLASAVAMAMGVYDVYRGSFMFRFAHHNEWVVLLAIGAVAELYVSFRMPAELKGEEAGGL